MLWGNMKACIQCLKRIDEVELQQIMVTQIREGTVLDVAAVFCCKDCVEDLNKMEIEIYMYHPKMQ